LQGEVYHPVPTDDTYRIGAGGLVFLAALATAAGMPGLPDLGPIIDPALEYTLESARAKQRPPPQSETTYFGLLNSHRTISELITHHSLSSLRNINMNTSNVPDPAILDGASEHVERWTTSQPFRFAVEFFDVHLLSEKERAYSQTVFYAGSWWNVYVQTIRKKDKGGQQLGVYLHRQSLAEAFPKASSPGFRSKSSVGGGEAVGADEEDAKQGAKGKDQGKEGYYEDTRRVSKVCLHPIPYVYLY
jgi:hypothetical protein